MLAQIDNERKEQAKSERTCKRWHRHVPQLLVFFALLWLLLIATACGEATPTQHAKQDPVMPHIQKEDRGWVDPTNTVDTAKLAALRQVSDRFQTEGFQLSGAFFSDIASDPSRFASDFGKQNGIGSGTKDNGLVIIVLLDRKGTDGNKPYIFVAPGRGLGGLLNDAKVTRFREAYFNPLRAQNKWQDGLILLSNKFADYLNTPAAVEFKDENLQHTASNTQSPDWQATFWLLFWGIVILVWLIQGVRRFIAWLRRGRHRDKTGSFTSQSSSSGSIWESSSSSSSWDSSSSSYSSADSSYGGGGSFDGGGSGG